MDASAAAILQIGIVLMLAAAAGWVMRRIGLPAVIGYLAIGLLVSPFTPGYVADRHQLQLFADIGVVLLLFEVGIEIDPLKLGADKRNFLWLVPHPHRRGGSLGFIGGGGRWTGVEGRADPWSLGRSLVQRRRGQHHPKPPAHDEPGHESCPPGVECPPRRDWSGPRGCDARDARSSRKATVVGRGQHCGLRRGDGGGAGALLPFRDLFAVLFFVAVGSLIDPAGIPSALGWIGLVLGLVLLVKGGSIYGLARLIRLPDVSAWQLGAGLGQIGEFSFVLASVGVAEGLITPQVYAAILSGVVATIALSTVVVRRPA